MEDINAIMAELRGLLEKATPGEWTPIVNGNTVKSHGVVSYAPDNQGWFKKVCAGISPNTANAAFIAYVHNHLPELLAEIDRLRADLESAEQGNDMLDDKIYQQAQEIERLTAELARATQNKGCAYCKDGRAKHSYDDTDGMMMAIHPSKPNANGYTSAAWWATINFRGEQRDFYVDYCPMCGRRLTPIRPDELNANCGDCVERGPAKQAEKEGQGNAEG